MIKKLFLGLLGLIILVVGSVLVIASTGEADKYLSRNTTVNAPIDVVFSHVNDLEKWNSWSPWKAMDPGMKVTYGPTRVGTGAWYTWNGEKAGQGKLTITASVTNESLATSIDFGEMGMGSGSWEFTQRGDAVEVTWGFTSHGRNLLDKVFHLFLDSMLGPQFESGLATLKAKAEAAAASG